MDVLMVLREEAELAKGDGLPDTAEQFQAAVDEIERLTAIVDNLPKCWGLNEAGKLVWDVPVVPSRTSNLWMVTKHPILDPRTSPREWPVYLALLSVELVVIYASGDLDCLVRVRDDSGKEYDVYASELYDTVHAARVAKSQRPSAEECELDGHRGLGRLIGADAIEAAEEE